MSVQDIKKKKKAVIAAFIDPANMLTEQEKIVRKIDEEHLGQIDAQELKIKDIILDWAEQLRHKGEIAIDRISKHLHEKLQGRACQGYISEVLPDEYKNESIMRGVRARSTSLTNGKKPQKSQVIKSLKEQAKAKDKEIEDLKKIIKDLKEIQRRNCVRMRDLWLENSDPKMSDKEIAEGIRIAARPIIDYFNREIANRFRLRQFTDDNRSKVKVKVQA